MVFPKLKRIQMAAVFFLVMSLQSLQALENGISLMPPSRKSESIFRELSEAGFSPEYQHLTPVNEDNLFPENIIITINGNPDAEDNKSSVKNVIFAFTQDFYIDDSTFVIEFLEGITKENLPFSCTVLLSAAENEFSIKNSFPSPNPTETFIEQIYENSSVCALCIYHTKGDREIISGSDREISPLWLVSAVHSSFAEEDRDIKIFPNYIFRIYRNLKGEDSRTGLFLKRGIAAAGIGVHRNDGKIIVSLTKSLVKKRSDRYDRNYSFVKLFNRVFFINESTSVVLFITFTFLILLKLCFEAFTKNSINYSRIKNLTRTFFWIPVYIILTALIFYLNMKITSSLIFSSLSSITVMLILFILQMHMNFYVSFSGFAFQMLIAGAANIFIFSSIQFSLMYFFLFEYLIIFISSRQKNTAVLIICFLILLFSGIHLIESILAPVNASRVFHDMPVTFALCIVYSCAIFPLQLLWLRIIMRLKIIENSPRSNKIVTCSGYALAVLITTGILSTSIFCTKSIFFSKSEKLSDSSKTEKKAELEQSPQLKVHKTDSVFYGIRTGHLYIEAPHRYIKYDITVEAENSSPLFDSNFLYEFTDQKKVRFILPEFPAEKLEIVYSSEEKVNPRINIDAWTLNGSGELTHEFISL